LVIFSASRNRLQDNPIIGHIFNMVSASLVGRVLQFATTIAAAAWLLPGQLGLWPLFLALTQVPMVLGMMRLDIAITLAKTDEAARVLCSIAAIGTVIVAGATALFMILAPQLVQYYFQIAVNFNAVVIAFSFILLMNLMSIYQAWLTRSHRFKVISVHTIIYPAVTFLLCTVFFAYSLLNGLSFIFANVAGYAAGIFFLLLKAPDLSIAQLLWPKKPLKSMVLRLKEYRSYPLLYTPYSLSQGIQERAVQLILGGVYGLSILGQFFLVRQLLQGSAALIAQPVRQVIFAHYINNAQKPGELLRLSKIMGGIAAVTAPLTLLAGREGGGLLAVLLGKEWVGVQGIFFWTIWFAWATISVSWIDRLFDVAWRQKLAVSLQLISDAIILALAACIAYSGGTFTHYVAAYSIAATAYNFVWSIAALRVAGLPFKHAIIPILMAASGLAIALIAEYLSAHILPMHLTLARILGCLIAIVITVALVRIMWRAYTHSIEQTGMNNEQA
jgi:O-antigen/teichoic acid export membrane protein